MIELLILYVLSEYENTMYGILKSILKSFGSYTTPSFGAIKPGLTRLEKDGNIRSRKTMSDGGKLSAFYSITSTGRETLKRLILEKITTNPLQFKQIANVKLSCASYLANDERTKLFENIKKLAMEHKFSAEKALSNEKTLTFYQRIILDNSIVEYKNFISLIENLEKDNNSK